MRNMLLNYKFIGNIKKHRNSSTEIQWRRSNFAKFEELKKMIKPECWKCIRGVRLY